MASQAGKPNVLFLLPPGWDALSKALFGHEAFNSFLHGKDHYAPQQIEYFVCFRPPHGFLKTLPRLKAIFSLGAGVDGFLRDPEFPRHLPVVRFVDETLQREMAQYFENMGDLTPDRSMVPLPEIFHLD